MALDLTHLNEAQRKSVLHTGGPAVVYAGAGSGKTRVICHRIAWLIENHVCASSILAVTFTNKAASEMRERIHALIGEAHAKQLTVCTFHAFCAKFLRIYVSELGYTSSFSIYDDSDQKALIKDILKTMNISEQLMSSATVKSKIDRIKNQGLTATDYLNEIKQKAELPHREKTLSYTRFGENYQADVMQKAYEMYQSALKRQNAMDFNDLLLVMYELLREKPHILQSLQNRFLHFLIDEFQDTNPLQFKLISLLSPHTHNLFIVGDDDQSIYSWRGAEPSFILNFAQIFPKAATYKLEENYRSTSRIIEAASEIISYNRTRAPKKLYTNREQGEPILLQAFFNPQDEAAFIANQIYTSLTSQEEKNSEACLSQFCILYRTNAQSRSLEDELRRRMIPYIIYGSVRFYERAEVKILLSHLSLLINPHDDAAFQKIINTPRRGLGEKALESLKELATSRRASLLSAAGELAYGNLENVLGRSLTTVKKWVMMFQSLQQDLKSQMPPSELLSRITTLVNFEAYLQQTYPEDFDERWLNIIELKNALIQFQEEHKHLSSEEILGQFIERALLTIEPSRYNVREGLADAVTMMTIHAAKGLEFQRVFLTGLEEGVLPHQNSLYDEGSIEEERRLMYVAMTRAQKALTLTYCMSNRYKLFMQAQKSRFLRELPHSCVHVKGPFEGRGRPSPSLSFSKSKPKNLF